jgi:serine/threonine protein kinase
MTAGAYQLLAPLGEGGMGSVWAATHVPSGREVALKFVKGRPDAHHSGRLLREAWAASAIDHPNVVEVFEVFEHVPGVPVIAMARLRGATLRQPLEQRGSLGLLETAALLRPVVSAIEAAHARGIVHRDLKPENIFLDESTGVKRVKVVDFGIAKLVAPEGGLATWSTLTMTGAAVGTPCYMAPEQAWGEAVDHRADIWALGVVLYECLSGVRPIEGDTFGQFLKNISRSGIMPLSALVPELPEVLSTLVDRMLLRDREQRPRDLAEVASVLSRFAG